MKFFVRSSVFRGLSLAVLGQLMVFPTARAGDDPRTQGTLSTWDIALGGGAVARPTYEGSNRYTALPAPLVNITWTWADHISVGTSGLSAYAHLGAWRLGGALIYDGGRQDHQGNGLFRSGDDRLRGLGNIDAALGGKMFASYTFGAATFSGSLAKFTGRQNSGALGDVSMSVPYKLTQRMTLTWRTGATWQDRSYARTFFGITSGQAATSGYLPFTAEGGLKDITAGFALNYQFDRHWFATASADAEKLAGAAARSPITFASTSASGRIMFGYHF